MKVYSSIDIDPINALRQKAHNLLNSNMMNYRENAEHFTSAMFEFMAEQDKRIKELEAALGEDDRA